MPKPFVRPAIYRRGVARLFATIFIVLAAIAFAVIEDSRMASAGRDSVDIANGPFRIGERLSYTISFERFPNAAYAEVYVASRGRLSDRDAIEVRARFKTLDIVSAAFYFVDESRTTFVSADTGLPLYAARTQSQGGLPTETISNFLTAPTPHVDLVALIYKIRASGGNGALTLIENDRTYGVTFQSGLSEKVKTEIGEYDTNVVSVQSDFFTEIGIRDVRINLSTDDAKLPALVRFRTAKGEFRARLSSVQLIDPEPETSPTPGTAATPRSTPPTRPSATPQPYLANQPLVPELAFDLGESLEYRITSGGRPVGTVALRAKERRQFMGADSLLLAAEVVSIEPGQRLFAPGDFIRAQVDPETLAPRQVEIKFSGSLSGFNQVARFDPRGSGVTFGGGTRVESPIGTHSIISLLYALRSFNLKPSRNTSNPVNDTRVAVFWETQPWVFTLRPSPAAELTLPGGEKVAAQMISVTTGNPTLDQLRIRVWLGNTEQRVPLRLMMGAYQADLISPAPVLSK